MSDPASFHPLPWYRHRWPWLLMAGPFVVVIAGFITLWLALSSDDGLVAEDYYQRGLTIQQTLHRSERARTLGLVAYLRLTPEQISLRLQSNDPRFPLPVALRITLSHPTRAGLDRTLLLHESDGEYRAKYRLPSAGHWLVQIEDEAGTWRLLGSVILPAAGETPVGGA